VVTSPDNKMSRSYRDISRWATIRIVSRRIDTVSIYRHIVSSLFLNFVCIILEKCWSYFNIRCNLVSFTYYVLMCFLHEGIKYLYLKETLKVLLTVSWACHVYCKTKIPTLLLGNVDIIDFETKKTCLFVHYQENMYTVMLYCMQTI